MTRIVVIPATAGLVYTQYMMLSSDGNETTVPRGKFSYGDQDAHGVDLSLIRENLKLTPAERLLRGDRARRNALRLLEYGRRQRQADNGAE